MLVVFTCDRCFSPCIFAIRTSGREVDSAVLDSGIRRSPYLGRCFDCRVHHSLILWRASFRNGRTSRVGRQRAGAPAVAAWLAHKHIPADVPRGVLSQRAFHQMVTTTPMPVVEEFHVPMESLQLAYASVAPINLRHSLRRSTDCR
jgi:hypothetical protein